MVPTNRAMIRKDYADVVFPHGKEKFTAIVEEIKDCHERGQPCWSVRSRSKNPNAWPGI